MHKPQLFIVAIGLLSFLIYLATLAPTITWRNDGVDSGDLATAVAVGGVPHPPGYPTYLTLAELFKQLPFGDVAYRLNLLSAVSAALAVAVTGLLIYQSLTAASLWQLEKSKQLPIKPDPATTRHYCCAAAAALTLAFSRLFWSQAVIAEVYALHTLFVTLLFLAVSQLRPANQNWLGPGLFGLLGLSLGNHFSIILLMPLVLLGLARLHWNWWLIVTIAVSFLLGLSIYVIIPLRAAQMPPVNWGLATHWSGFAWLVMAKPYAQFLFKLPWEFVPARLGTMTYFLAETFIWWGLPVGLMGWLNLLRLNRLLGYGSLVAFLLIVTYALGYNTTDSYVYLLPALVIFSLWVGWGLNDLAYSLQNKFKQHSLIGWGILLLPLLSLWLNFSDQNLSQDFEALVYAQRTLQAVEPNAVIITDNDPYTFALWYGRYGLGLRPDVAIVNSNLLPYTWYRQSLLFTHPNLLLVSGENRPLTTLPNFFRSNLSQSPIYVATLQPFNLMGYHLEPQGHLRDVQKLAPD